MSFLSPLLLAGIALIGIPIALHLAMRREPQRLVFPALRLLKRRRQVNETRLRLRRWLLLALRCLAVALLALALARPVLLPPGSKGAARPDSLKQGFAIAMVFDNGPNMAYQSRNQSRLEVAQETAEWLLNRLPSETDVIIADRRKWNGAMQDKPDGALLRVGRIEIAEATRPLASTLNDALSQLDDLAASRREVYFFTDLSSGVWNDSMLDNLTAELEQRPGISLQLIDVGVNRPQNVAIRSLELEQESLAMGQPLRLRATISANGKSTPTTAQLWIEEPDEVGKPKLVKRDERPVVFGAPTSAGETLPVGQVVTTSRQTDVLFSINGLEEGFHGGVVQLAASDPLSLDDRRFFCVEVKPPPSLLLVAQQPEEARFFREAVAPSLLEPGLVPPYDCTIVRYGEIAQQSLNDYSTIVMLDPPPLDDAVWNSLVDYTTGGGALGVALGRHASLEGFNRSAAQRLLPAKLRWRSRDSTYLRPIEYSHPLLNRMADYAEAIPWPAYPVFQRWEIDSLNKGAAVVASYADGAPAVIDQLFGQGRVVMVTTSFSDRLNQPEPWNLLPTGEDPWPFMLLANGIVEYLCGLQATRLNLEAGETVVVPLPSGLDITGYVLRMPSGDAIRKSRLPGQSQITIGTADKTGLYEIAAGGEANGWHRLFAINLSEEAGQLERVPFGQIEERLGKDRVSLVHDRDGLARSIQLVRVGRELYAWVIALVVLVFLAEQFVSNRFYSDSSELHSVDINREVSQL